jgi:hypothetical protein
MNSNTPPPTPRKPSRGRFYLCLDVQTTSGDRPQLVSVEAVLLRHDPPDTVYRKIDELAYLVLPRYGYSATRHVQDMRYHGVTAERLAREGKDSAVVVSALVDMMRRATGLSMDFDDAVTVVGHGASALMGGLMATLVVDSELGGFYEDFVSLCRVTECTQEAAVTTLPGLPYYTLENVLAQVGIGIPRSRAEAVASLFLHFRNAEPEGGESVAVSSLK